MRHPEGTRVLTIIASLILAMAVGGGGCITTNPPTTENKPEGKLIRDLAYVKAIAIPYSDDADPEPEGAEIKLAWYDSKSELIFFRNIHMQVSIEIFAAKSGVYPIYYTECVYNGEAEIDSSVYGIRIPFEDIKANPQIHSSVGHANLTIQTQQQGEFPIEDIAIPLFPYEKRVGED